MKGVKICGLTRAEDIAYVNCLKPDYIGFVFAPSKRQVDKQKAKALIDLIEPGVKPGVKTVGVFVNQPVSEVNEIIRYCSLDIAQLHGEETPGECDNVQCAVWKGIRVKDRKSIADMENYKVEGYLLDAYRKEHYGGTGEGFDWKLLKEVKEKKIILAGGITPEKVHLAAALPMVEVIDVSSGVETNGKKDFNKIKLLLERVRKNGK